MNYNQFYRRKNRVKRKYTAEEKRNLLRAGTGIIYGIIGGAATGLVLVGSYGLFI